MGPHNTLTIPSQSPNNTLTTPSQHPLYNPVVWPYILNLNGFFTLKILKIHFYYIYTHTHTHTHTHTGCPGSMPKFLKCGLDPAPATYGAPRPVLRSHIYIYIYIYINKYINAISFIYIKNALSITQLFGRIF